MTHNNATRAARITSNRQAQAAVLRTMGSTDLVVATRRRRHTAKPSGRRSRPRVNIAKHAADTCVAQRSGRDLRRYAEHVSHDAAGQDDVNGQHEGRARGKYWWLRWVVLGIVAIVLAVEVALVWDQLAKAWPEPLSAKWWWLLASALAAVALMHSFAQIQRTLLASAGVRVKQLRSEAAYYAANSLSTTLPGGPVLAATFLLRQQRIWGASTLVASWQLVMSGVLQAVGWRCSGWAALSSSAPRTTRSRCCSPWAASSRCCCWPRLWRHDPN